MVNWVVSLLRADSDDVNRLRKAIRKTLHNIPDQVLDSLTTDHPDPRLIPGLIGLLTVNRKKIDESAATVLAAIGPPAVESLIRVLQSGPLDAQRWSVSILGQIGPAAAPAAEPLVQQLCSNRPWRAKEALKQIGPSCQRFVIQGLVNGSSPVKNLCLEIVFFRDRVADRLDEHFRQLQEVQRDKGGPRVTGLQRDHVGR